jgi:L-fucose isomerase-like protein
MNQILNQNKRTKKNESKDNQSSMGDLTMGRRPFLRSMGIAAFAAQMGMLDFASSLFAEPEKKGMPVVRVAFVRPDVDRYFMGWPGADWDNPKHQEHYTQILTQAGRDQNVDVRFTKQLIEDENVTDKFLEDVKNEQPDGLIIISMSLNVSWPHVNRIAKERGDIPTIVFSPVGTSFTGHLQETRGIPGVFVGAIEDEEWLAEAVHMLDTVWKMKNTRLLIVRGNERREEKVKHLGTTLCYYPESDFCKAARSTKVTDKIRDIADYYEKSSVKIVEPTSEDILNAAKMYVTCRTVMDQENCDGISINCLPMVSAEIGSDNHIWEPCLAFSKLRDEGIVGGCESDVHAALSMRLCHLLVKRPGFMQDPFPLTVDNTFGGAHCSCGTRLRGFDKDPEPLILRSHQEPDRGVATQVLWPVGERMTLMEMVSTDVGYNRMRLGSGQVVRNIEPDPQGHDPYEEAGGCRTSVVVTVDNCKDTRNIKGFHQLFILGDVAQKFRNYAQLANIEVVDMSA